MGEGGGGWHLNHQKKKNSLTKDATYIRMFYKYEAAGEANPLDTTTVSWLPLQRQSFQIIFFVLQYPFPIYTLHHTTTKISNCNLNST